MIIELEKDRIKCGVSWSIENINILLTQIEFYRKINIKSISLWKDYNLFVFWFL